MRFSGVGGITRHELLVYTNKLFGRHKVNLGDFGS